MDPVLLLLPILALFSLPQALSFHRHGYSGLYWFLVCLPGPFEAGIAHIFLSDRAMQSRIDEWRIDLERRVDLAGAPPPLAPDLLDTAHTVIDDDSQREPGPQRATRSSSPPPFDLSSSDLFGVRLGGTRRVVALMHKADLIARHHVGGVVRTAPTAFRIAFVVFALCFRTFGFEPFKIPSPSMYPTLAVGDSLYVNKFIYGPLVPGTQQRLFEGAAVRRGEVVVFIYPQDPSKDFIKRVIGVAGDRVWVREDGSIEVNGHPIDRCEVGPWRGDDGEGITHGEVPLRRLFRESHGQYHYLTLLSRDPAERESAMAEFCVRAPCTVPSGHVFVMGDNRDNSYDSRYWGFVPLENVKGRGALIYWSVSPGEGLGVRSERIGRHVLGEPTVPSELAEGLRACQRISERTAPTRR